MPGAGPSTPNNWSVSLRAVRAITSRPPTGIATPCCGASRRCSMWTSRWPARRSNTPSPRSYAMPKRTLTMARADGSHAKLLDRLSRLDLLIVDDWAMAPLTEAERRDFLEICDGRYQVHSTLLTSQLPVASWHPQIGDPTVADSILDRLVHNAHRIELKGESMRKKRNGKNGGENS